MGDEGRAPLPFQLTKEVCDLGPNYVLQLNSPTILSSICFFYFFGEVTILSLICFFDTKQMHSIGIYSRLDQVFNAPNAVKEVWTGQFGLDRSVSFLHFLFQFVMYLIAGS